MQAFLRILLGCLTPFTHMGLLLGELYMLQLVHDSAW